MSAVADRLDRYADDEGRPQPHRAFARTAAWELRHPGQSWIVEAERLPADATDDAITAAFDAYLARTAPR